ncbi:uncharacterized protein SCHCODRAFT_02665915 [Schizophyllum commune H4-8]|uniref:Uncharacterized protein n=1 Tax=Schizophyllum commune (strain H4-8 / FGSC 9210) TaxID=578458 RepID=D8Q1W3_SCHCM|nr:uncharacterized protein SCHCODRAFT_02665915 [Schizophyllum commune H4-8]KAI5895595.1 hypothetical protein SCHCODRAFT_02665915 [Schizophyllum commune H4-8]
MGSPRSLNYMYRLPDWVRCVPLMCSTRCLNVIRRPPGFGRSAFLSTVTDCLDVLSPRPCKELWSGPLSGSCPRFDFNCGQILHIDMGRLTYETDEQLKENTANLLRSAVTRFLDKYQSYIGFSDKERTEVLAQCDPNGSLEDAMYLALTRDHPNVFTGLAPDHCNPLQSPVWPSHDLGRRGIHRQRAPRRIIRDGRRSHGVGVALVRGAGSR